MKDGGPAFPFTQDGGFFKEGYKGMSLRDYFAAKALQGILSDPRNMRIANEKEPSCEVDFIAKVSYQFADAMLKEREK